MKFLVVAESSPNSLDDLFVEQGESRADAEASHSVEISCSGKGEDSPVLGVPEAGDIRLLEGLPG